MQQYGLPQDRTRVFVIGMHKQFGDGIPPAFPAFGMRPFREFLSKSLPNVDRTKLNDNKRLNLTDYVFTVEYMVRPGAYEGNPLVVISVNRKIGAKWSSSTYFEYVPTLTTNNSQLLNFFVVFFRTDKGREYFLHPVERLCLQGFSMHICKYIPRSKMVKAAGSSVRSSVAFDA